MSERQKVICFLLWGNLDIFFFLQTVKFQGNMSMPSFELLTSLISMCHLTWMHLETGEDQFSVPNF